MAAWIRRRKGRAAGEERAPEAQRRVEAAPSPRAAPRRRAAVRDRFGSTLAFAVDGADREVPRLPPARRVRRLRRATLAGSITTPPGAPSSRPPSTPPPAPPPGRHK